MATTAAYPYQNFDNMPRFAQAWEAIAPRSSPDKIDDYDFVNLQVVLPDGKAHVLVLPLSKSHLTCQAKVRDEDDLDDLSVHPEQPRTCICVPELKGIIEATRRGKRGGAGKRPVDPPTTNDKGFPHFTGFESPTNPYHDRDAKIGSNSGYSSSGHFNSAAGKQQTQKPREQSSSSSSEGDKSGGKDGNGKRKRARKGKKSKRSKEENDKDGKDGKGGKDGKDGKDGKKENGKGK